MLDDVELPDSIVRAMKEVIEEMSSESILAFARAYPDLFPGYRLIKKNTRSFKRRILEVMIADGKAVPDPLLKLLSYNHLNQDLIDKLPLESLEIFFDDFHQYFGEDIFLTALLCDERQEVRSLALDHFAASGNEPDEDPEDESEELSPDLDERVKELKQELTRLKRELADSRKREKRLEDKIEKLRKELALKAEKLQTRKANADRIREKLQQNREELAALQTMVERKIEEGITAGMEERLRGWLAVPGSVQEQQLLDDSSELLDRVTQALEHQARVDRHSGNLRQLRQRLAELEQAHQEIARARSEALRVLSELSPLAREVELELNKIREKLKQLPKERQTLQPWLARINEAETAGELGSLDKLAGKMADQGILAPGDRKYIRERIREARDRHLDFSRFVLREKPEQPVAQDIIVDGHNVVLGPESFYLFHDTGHELTESGKRARLTGMIETAFVDNSLVTVRIVYDSPTRSENRVAANITEIYSGGGDADQRADDAIVDLLQKNMHRNSQEEKNSLVITDDRELSRRVRKLGADVLTVFEFSIMLRRRTDHFSEKI